MTIHYTDDTLLSVAAEDAHLAVCEECRERLTSFRSLEEILAMPEAWGGAPQGESASLAVLRQAASALAEADGAGEPLVHQLRSAPRAAWGELVAMDPRYATPAGVRALTEASETAIDTIPAEAVELGRLATEAGEKLRPGSWSEDAVLRLRGTAWRAYAYALFYTGRFTEAEAAAVRADAIFAGCVVDTYDRARVGIIRSLVAWGLQRPQESLDLARSAAAVFRDFGDEGRHASAMMAAVHALFGMREFAAAHDLLVEQEALLRDSQDHETYARLLGNLGYCCHQLGRREEALQHFRAASGMLRELGVHTEEIRIRWDIARLLMETGELAEAKATYAQIRRDFAEIGMVGASTMASLDEAEILLAEGRFAEVEAICQAAMRIFEETGVSYTSRALTALAYMREAARAKTATPVLIHTVREYLRRLPAEEQLLFVPPAE